MADTVYKLTHTGEQIDTAIDTVNMALTGGSASGNPVTIKNMLKNSIVSLKVNGLTTQAGSGTPSPTNIRPISGVGEYRANGYYTDIVVTTNGVPKTYTIGPMSAPLHDGDKLTWSGGSTVKVSIASKCLNIGAETNITKVSEEYNEYCISLTDSATNNYTYCTASFVAKESTSRCVARAFNALIRIPASSEIVTVEGFKNFAASNVAEFVYPLATPTTETVPISEPITNAAGDVTISAANTVDVTISGAASAAATLARLFTCTLLASAWATDTTTGKLAQTVDCAGMTATVTGAPPFVLPQQNTDTNEAQQEALALLAGGETLAGQAKFYCVDDAPETDLEIYFLGVEQNG
jgi:hypothetical protein